MTTAIQDLVNNVSTFEGFNAKMVSKTLRNLFSANPEEMVVSAIVLNMLSKHSNDAETRYCSELLVTPNSTSQRGSICEDGHCPVETTEVINLRERMTLALMSSFVFCAFNCLFDKFERSFKIPANCLSQKSATKTAATCSAVGATGAVSYTH